ncbi:hypothetical protein GCK32_015124 [Trichostrongylus colubriformis]|uniref:Uncharacterized protein n=1 Tax=Trichostrongylus colubriformis TaxID=6319 RepID=A0AAN8F6T9_TRICO
MLNSFLLQGTPDQLVAEKTDDLHKHGGEWYKKAVAVVENRDWVDKPRKQNDHFLELRQRYSFYGDEAIILSPLLHDPIPADSDMFAHLTAFDFVQTFLTCSPSVV